MADLVSMGELLIDFTPWGDGGRKAPLCPQSRGRPANVAVQAHRAGVSAGFLGRVGLDMFGGFLADTLKGCGVDTRGLSQDPDYATTLAFVQLSPEGDRDFSFYRNPGADTRLSFAETDLSIVEECKLLCFGSLLLTAEPPAARCTSWWTMPARWGRSPPMTPTGGRPCGRAGRKRASSA